MAIPVIGPQGQDGKQNTIDYARGRFGGSRGEIYVYDGSGEKVVEKILVDGGSRFGQLRSVKETTAVQRRAI